MKYKHFCEDMILTKDDEQKFLPSKNDFYSILNDAHIPYSDVMKPENLSKGQLPQIHSHVL